MPRSPQQRGVLLGMSKGASISIAVIATGIVSDLFGWSDGPDELQFRVRVLMSCFVAPAIALMIAIGRLASFRFRSPEDIDGSGLTSGTDHARVLQALLQNTLEQSLLLILVYSAWAIWVPIQWLDVLPLTSTMFLLGRVLFFVRYEHGAPARALGFTLTFYPTALLLLIFLGWSVVSTILNT